MNNKSSFSENISPSLVLVIICLVATIALAATYTVANPVIIQNQIKSANEARTEVLPEGDGFTAYDGKLLDGVDDCYVADNGAGMAITAEAKGFGGNVTVMVGIDADGNITGVKVTDHAETPGLGTKAADPEYLKAQYYGKGGMAESHINNDPDVAAISGATITSNAVYGAVVEAIAQFDACGGVK